MYAIDFEYDGKRLSDYGFIVCEFDSPSGASIVNVGSNIDFKKVSRNSGKIFNITGSAFSECITSTFDICKDDNVYSYDERMITDVEYLSLVRWLNRKKFLRFIPIYDCPCSISERRIYNASFNVEKIYISGKLYGLRLSMETDKPFAYGDERKYRFLFSTANETYTIKDMSTEIGFIYPNIKIKCLDAGDFSITNSLEQTETIIKNCSANEIITINGELLTIDTNLSSHTSIADDFNYSFFKIGNTYKDKRNTISVNHPCEIDVSYSPIIKDSP